MLMKNILTALALTGVATANPTGDLESRALTGTCSKPTQVYCCTQAFDFNLLFIRKVGSGCAPAPAPVSGTYTCPAGKNFLCCDGGQIPSGQNVVCTA
ncbi:hypothetical protein N7471_007812 [Penicillium samsonianum]|uniref:uncharacterized protein n=1 Tax=Penicillium samsonianum TaxID=1882272 RepID=UPI00254756A2|nr:uncharacterized protein N7471_007812 [Penicillium samsonianum]KAJ6132597.1 hypothetical protein N7471_007812 [Penicillium samsonianum]